MDKNLEKIQEMIDMFSSLFEVDGLGEPSADVPPSTNKLKKTRKTKNGKVELVSVEDELFPKEGTKKEQFREEVINIINSIIQGTSTIEDLIQFVRTPNVKESSEESSFKGAINILEQLILERNKENKVKKNEHECSQNGIKPGYKKELQDEIKRNADEMKNNHELANEYDHLAMQQKPGAVQDGFNDKAQDYHTSAQRNFSNKIDAIKKMSDALKTRNKAKD